MAKEVVTNKGLFMRRKTHHLPDLGLRGEIPPSHRMIPPSDRILGIFISRLHDERNIHLGEEKFFHV